MRNGLIRHRVEYRTVTNPEDYRRIVELRNEAYRSVGKLTPLDSLPAKAELNDPKTRVIGLHLDGELIGSVSFVVPELETPLESVEAALGYYPVILPPKTDSIEINRLCIHERYRQTDVLLGVFEQVHRTLVATNRSHIIISSDERLLPRYEEIGFRRTGLVYSRKFGVSGPLSILVTCQKRFGVYGLHVGPIRWNIYLASVAHALLAEGRFEHPVRQRALAFFYGLFAPIASWAFRHKVRTEVLKYERRKMEVFDRRDSSGSRTQSRRRTPFRHSSQG